MDSIGLLTGGDKLVLRGGYSRTHDYAFTNIALNIWSSFPFVAAVSSFPTIATTNLAGQSSQCDSKRLYGPTESTFRSQTR